MAWLIIAALGGCVDYELQGDKQACAALQKTLPKVPDDRKSACKKIRVSVYKTASGLHLVRHRKGRPPQDYLLSSDAAARLLLKSWASHSARGPLLAGFEPTKKVKKPSRGTVSPVPRPAARAPKSPEKVPEEGATLAEITPEIPRSMPTEPVALQPASDAETTGPVEAVVLPQVEVLPEPEPEAPQVLAEAPGSAPAAEPKTSADGDVGLSAEAPAVLLDTTLGAAVSSGLMLDEGVFFGLRLQGPGIVWGDLHAHGHLSLWRGLAQASKPTQGGYQRGGFDSMLMLSYRRFGVPFGLTPGIGLGVTRAMTVRNQDCSTLACAPMGGVQLNDEYRLAQWVFAAQANLSAHLDLSPHLSLNLGGYFHWWPGQDQDLSLPAYAQQLPKALSDPLGLPELPQFQVGGTLGLRWQL